MSQKTYSAEEVAKAVLKRCQELVKEQELKKAEKIAKAEEIDKCGDMSMGKSDKLKNFLDKKKKKEAMKKAGSFDALAGSVAQTGGPSIASQIGFGKKEVKKGYADEKHIKGVHRTSEQAHNRKGGISEAGSATRFAGNKNLTFFKEKNKARAKQEHKKVLSELKEQKAPNLPKSEEASKAVGLKPVNAPAAPKVDDISKPPKAATTLKSFMAQKKK